MIVYVTLHCSPLTVTVAISFVIEALPEMHNTDMQSKYSTIIVIIVMYAYICQ